MHTVEPDVVTDVLIVGSGPPAASGEDAERLLTEAVRRILGHA